MGTPQRYDVPGPNRSTMTVLLTEDEAKTLYGDGAVLADAQPRQRSDEEVAARRVTSLDGSVPTDANGPHPLAGEAKAVEPGDAADDEDQGETEATPPPAAARTAKKANTRARSPRT